MNGIAKVGYLGGEGGDPRDIQQCNRPRQVVSVYVYTNGNVINALKFDYMDEHGVTRTGGTWGVTTGLTAKVFEIPNGDYLQEISGTYGPYLDVEKCITSLRFVTRARRASPHGNANGGTAFKIPVLSDGKIAAFFARSGDVIDALGVYICP